MKKQSPAADYFNVCKLYLKFQSWKDIRERIVQMRALHVLWRGCFQSLMEVAESPDPEIWYALGDAFSNGRGTKRDRSEAIRWFQRAAEAGHTRAMVRLGSCLKHPADSSLADKAGAVQWFRKAADQGDSGGMVSLGFSYRGGSGVPCDYEEAVRWFIKAVEAGDKYSLLHVGRMYYYYLNSPKEAVRWLLRAAEAQLSDSYIQLARVYDDRYSEVYNPIEATRWYHVIADSRKGYAMLALARRYRDGVGTERDPEKAKDWLRSLIQLPTAGRAFYKKAVKILNEMENELQY